MSLAKALAWAPSLAALVVVGKLGVDVAHPPPLVVELPASCSALERACTVGLPARRDRVLAVRLLVPGAESAVGGWEVCVRGLCKEAPTHLRYGWLDLPAGHALIGEAVVLRVRGEAPRLRLSPTLPARAVFAWPGALAVLERAYSSLASAMRNGSRRDSSSPADSARRPP
jgi:hypothetical protein